MPKYVRREGDTCSKASECGTTLSCVLQTDGEKRCQKQVIGSKAYCEYRQQTYRGAELPEPTGIRTYVGQSCAQPKSSAIVTDSVDEPTACCRYTF